MSEMLKIKKLPVRKLPRRKAVEKLPKLSEVFVEYIQYYIKGLTAGSREFFLSICDIEEEPLRILQEAELEEYTAVVVEEDDYSRAVQVRNAVELQKIVLFSGEGVKQIDSLKDFNEYPVLCPDKELFWICIRRAFHVYLRKEVREFLDVLLEDGEAVFWEFFKYIYQSIQDGELSPVKLNENLPCLGIWRSSKGKFLKKGEIRRMIKLSRDTAIERRLTKALTENLIHGENEKGKSYESIVSENLARGELKRIREKIPFEIAEEWLKGVPKPEFSYIFAPVESIVEEVSYTCSYEYSIREHDIRSIEEIEAEWLQDRDNSQLDLAINWEEYKVLGGKGIVEGQLEKLQNKVEILNLPQEKKLILTQRLEELSVLYWNAYDRVTNLTPVCLYGFCREAEWYTQAYFTLLSYILTDETVRRELVGAGIVSELENLGCVKAGTRIQMPFYHPVRVVYYMGLKEMYEYVRQLQAEEGIRNFSERILLALVENLKLRFPVEFINWDGDLYALDYATLRDGGVVEFTDNREEVVYSVLDFRLAEWQIEDYFRRHKFHTEFTVAMVEISDLTGLISLVDRIRKLAEEPGYNIGGVDFLILSSREEELKKQLSRMWDFMGTDELVHFRFGRNQYYKEGRYDVQAVIQAADITVFADSSTLYHEPRMVRYTKEVNMTSNRLAKLDISWQVKNYFQSGASDIAVLWDTLQQAQMRRTEGLWRRSSREINGNVLAVVNQTVEEDEQKTVVLMSSNDNVLNEIHDRNYVQASRYGDGGRNIMILNYDKVRYAHRMSVEHNNRILCSLTEFYSRALGMQDICGLIFPGMQDVVLTFYLEGSDIGCRCAAYWKLGEEEKGWKNICKDWIIWQLKMASGGRNILEKYFHELLLGQWSEEVRSVAEVLMVRKLINTGNVSICFQEAEIDDWVNKFILDVDRLEALQIQEILATLEKVEVIDSQWLQYFRERNVEETLDRIMEADQNGRFLESEMRKKLEELKSRIYTA